MPERSIEALQFGDKTIYVEVTEVQLEPEALSASRPGLPEHLEYTSVRDKVTSAGEAVRDVIAVLAESVSAGMAHLRHDEWKLEISLGFKAHSNIPFIAAGEGNDTVKVSATWKRPQE